MYISDVNKYIEHLYAINPDVQPATVNTPSWVDPFKIEGMAEAIESIKAHSSVLVCGDYDCDGLTATAILAAALSKAGKPTVGWCIPNPVTNGYGFKADMVQDMYDLVITVDNGISCIDELRKCGKDFIVVDHHKGVKEPGCIIIDPSADDDKSPFHGWCGAGLALKVAQALGIDDPYLTILAMVGTVGDKVPVVGDNRDIMLRGMRYLHEGVYCPPGIDDIMWEGRNGFSDVSRKVCTVIGAGPKVDPDSGTNVVAALLGGMSRLVTNEMFRDFEVKRKELAMEMRAVAEADATPGKRVYVIDSKLRSFRGTYASIVARATGVPCAVIVGDGYKYSGSVRVPDESGDMYDVTEYLKRHEWMFTDIGGHAAVAGFTMPASNLEEFTKVMDGLTPVVKSDDEDVVVVPLSAARSLQIELDKLQPFGDGFKLPKTAYKVEAADTMYMDRFGRSGEHVRIRTSDGVQVNFWRKTPEEVQKYIKERGGIIEGNAEWNTYNGVTRLQLNV